MSTTGDRPDHVSDDLLLLATDGELPARDAAWVAEHVAACWSCRARRDQIEAMIGDIVEYRNWMVERHLPRPAGSRAMFLAHLQELGAGKGRPAIWGRLANILRVCLSIGFRTAWAGGVVAAGLLMFLVLRLRDVPAVSASELLQKAHASEASVLRSLNRPVVYQKLRIRSGNQAITRTIYRDPTGKRQAEPVDAAEHRLDETQRGSQPTAPMAELQQTFQNAALNWQEPLSASSYRAWHDSIARKQDEVIRPQKDLLTLRTTTEEGPIAEAFFTVRASDFHPVAEIVRLEDNRQIEITELAYAILSLDAVNPAIFEPQPLPSRSAPPDVSPPATVSQFPGEAELAEAELRTRAALHSVGGDLGEQIEIRRGAAGAVEIRGLTETAERKKEILAALRGIPHLTPRLETVEEAAHKQPRSAPFTATPVSGPSVTAGPVLQRKLQEQFPNAEERTAFVNQALTRAQEAMDHAWALRRLRDRYTTEEVAHLSGSARRTLEAMIRDHLAALRRSVDGERALLSPVLAWEAFAPPQPEARSADDWRAAAARIFESVQKMQESVAALLAGSGQAADPATLRSVIDSALALLETELPLFQKRISGPFLWEGKESR